MTCTCSKKPTVDIIRGTTPTLEFVMPFDVKDMPALYITFKQRGETILEKSAEDVQCNGDTITLKLTQDETLKMHTGQDSYVQIRAKSNAGDAVASDIIPLTIHRVLKDGVI